MLTTKKRAKRHMIVLGAALALVLAGCMPPGPRALLRGEKHLKEQRYEDALEDFQEAIEPLRDNAQAWNHLGLAYHYLGKQREAMEAYQHAKKLDPNLASASFNAGCLAMEVGNFSLAVDYLTTYTSLQPRSLEGVLRLGSAQVHLGAQASGAQKASLLAAAQRCFEFINHVHPSAEADNGLGLVAYYRGRPRDAIFYFDAALQVQPDYAPALLNSAIEYHLHATDHKIALEKYRAYLALTPRPPNYASVNTVVQQIEAELAPRPVPPPAGPLTATNPAVVIAPPPTNRPSSIRPPPATNPQPAVVQNEQPAPVKRQLPHVDTPRVEQKPAVLEPRPPVSPPTTVVTHPVTQPQVVTRPANDKPAVVAAPPPTNPVVVTQAPPPVVTIATSSPPVVSVPTPSKPVDASSNVAPAQPAEQNTSAPPIVPPPPPEKRSMMAKLNPMHWFGGSKRDAPPEVTSNPRLDGSYVTPLAASSNSPAVTPQMVMASIPRYHYLNPARTAPGNQVEAVKVFQRGVTEHEERHFSEAVALYEKAANLDPAFFDAYYNLGVAAYQLGDMAASLTAYEHALSLNPEYRDLRYNFALALSKANYSLDAVNEFQRVVQKTPDDPRVHLALGNLYAQKLADSAQARSHYEKAIELQPQLPQAPAIRDWLAANPR